VAHHPSRSAVVLVLLLGTFALAVPYVSSTVDRWLFSADETKPKWNTKRPSSGQPEAQARDAAGGGSLRPASPDLLPAGRTSASQPPMPNRDEAFAFDFQEDPRRSAGGPQPAVRPAEHVVASQPPARDLPALNRELQNLGAAYLVVEELASGGRYECRCLMPISPENVYQKAFSGSGSTPQAAMEQVVAEIRAWRRVGQASSPAMNER